MAKYKIYAKVFLSLPHGYYSEYRCVRRDMISNSTKKKILENKFRKK